MIMYKHVEYYYVNSFGMSNGSLSGNITIFDPYVQVQTCRSSIFHD